LGNLKSKDNKCKFLATFCATQNTKTNVGASQKAKTKALHLKRKNIYSQMIHKIFIGSNKKLAQVEKFTTIKISYSFTCT
jgi:hypothetical protein